MAYIPVSPGEITSSSSVRCRIKDFSGGLCKTLSDLDIADNQLSFMSNMLSSGAALAVRGGILEKEKLAGTFHSLLREEYGESRIFHCGNTLYRFDGETLTALSSALPDKNSTLYRMNGKVYALTEDEKIFELAEDFSVCEKAPYVPTVTESDDLGETFTVNEPINMLSRKIKTVYRCGNRTSVTLTLPYEIDTSVAPVFTVDGVQTTFTNHSAQGNKKYFISDFQSVNGTVLEMEYTVGEESFAIYRKQVYGSRLAVCFGGSTAGGSRVFLTGNDAFPGQYFSSELVNPLYFPDTRRETLGDGSESVCDAEKRYEKLYFFTEHHIFSMSYGFDEKNGASFTVSEINTPVGCGMKGSVRLIDNTLVFAHRKKGVFLLQSTDIFSELNVREISQNLTSGGSFAQGENFCSCDADRKYYLFDGQTLFVWDYGATPYYSSGDSAKAGGRLCWESLSGFSGTKALFALSGVLYAIREREGKMILACYDENADHDALLVFPETENETENETESETETSVENVDFSAGFATKSYDFGIPYRPKRLTEFSFTYACADRIPKLTLHFSGDGKRFYDIRVPLSTKSGSIRLRIPPFSAYRFKLEAEISAGRLSFRDPVFTYILCPRAKMR